MAHQEGASLSHQVGASKPGRVPGWGVLSTTSNRLGVEVLRRHRVDLVVRVLGEELLRQVAVLRCFEQRRRCRRGPSPSSPFARAVARARQIHETPRSHNNRGRHARRRHYTRARERASGVTRRARGGAVRHARPVASKGLGRQSRTKREACSLNWHSYRRLRDFDVAGRARRGCS